MSAGTAYSKRFPGGFVDLPSQTTPVDQQFLNAVEAALLQLIGAPPTADGQVAQWDYANTRFGPALLLNKNIDPAAAIAKSKLDFTGANGIVNADIAGAAAIARSKLNFGSGLVDADIAAAAAIAISKLAGYPTDATKFLRGDGSWQIDGGAELTYDETTASVGSITGTTSGTATSILTSTAFTADGTSRYIVMFFWPFSAMSLANARIVVELYEDATSVGTTQVVQGGTGGNNFDGGILVRRRTPSAGSHTYTVKAWVPDGGTGTIGAGVGSGAGTAVPAFIRVAKA